MNRFLKFKINISNIKFESYECFLADFSVSFFYLNIKVKKSGSNQIKTVNKQMINKDIIL